MVSWRYMEGKGRNCFSTTHSRRQQAARCLCACYGGVPVEGTPQNSGCTNEVNNRYGHGRKGASWWLVDKTQHRPCFVFQALSAARRCSSLTCFHLFFCRFSGRLLRRCWSLASCFDEHNCHCARARTNHIAVGWLHNLSSLCFTLFCLCTYWPFYIVVMHAQTRS